MNTPSNPIFSWQKILIACLMTMTIVFTSVISVLPGSAKATKSEEDPSLTAYLPIALQNYPLTTAFGVTLDNIDTANGLDKLAEAGMTWTRHGFIWSSIEPTEGQRIWNSTTEQGLIDAAALEVTPIMLIESTPAWALKDGFSCGAVAQDKFSALGAFAFDLVKRYSVHPYNVRYWELWNEPDAAGILGCWGDPSDTQYYGGYYYGLMLREAYPQIKAADPNAQVLVGGLLLDCDPNNPPSGINCTPSKFLAGILASGGGPYFDGVSFHAYDYYNGSGTYAFSNWGSSSSTTGPSAIAKAAYLRTVLNQYGYGNKYLINTETAVFYGPNVMTPRCDASAPADVEETKVYHLIHTYSSSIAEGFKGSVWYSAFGVRCSGLLNTDLSSKPAYEAYQFAYQKLDDAKFSRKITEYNGLMGYEYNLTGRKLWVIWAKDGASHPIDLPKLPLIVHYVGADGIAVVETPAIQITVGVSPYFIEFTN